MLYQPVYCIVNLFDCHVCCWGVSEFRCLKLEQIANEESPSEKNDHRTVKFGVPHLGGLKLVELVTSVRHCLTSCQRQRQQQQQPQPSA